MQYDAFPMATTATKQSEAESVCDVCLIAIFDDSKRKTIGSRSVKFQVMVKDGFHPFNHLNASGFKYPSEEILGTEKRA